MQDSFSGLFGRNSNVEIYGCDIRSVKGTYREHADVQEIIIRDSSNFTNITITENRDEHVVEKANQRHRSQPHASEAKPDPEELSDNEQAPEEGSHTGQRYMSDMLLQAPVPIGLTPKAANFYQLLMLSASKDQHMHQEGTNTNERGASLNTHNTVKHRTKGKGRRNTPQKHILVPQETPKAISPQSNVLLDMSVPAAPSSPRSTGTAEVPNVPLASSLYPTRFDTPIEIYNGVVNEVIEENKTTNTNSGIVFNASVESYTSVSFNGR